MKSLKWLLLLSLLLLGIPTMGHAETEGKAELEFIVADVYYQDQSLLVEGYLANPGNTVLSNISNLTLDVYNASGDLIDGGSFENNKDLMNLSLSPGHFDFWAFQIDDAAQGDLTDYSVSYQADYEVGEDSSLPKGTHVFINNNALKSDVSPVIVNGRTFVPMRAIFEQMGASVQWDANTSTVTAQKGEVTLVHQIGSNQFKVNDEVLSFDSSSMIKQGRTMVPLRVIAESFGAIFWAKNGETMTIGIISE